jgi:hypothetical protein
MLLIVNSMPKCGSTWFHNFIGRGLTALDHPTPHRAVQGFAVALNARANPGSVDGANLQALIAAARDQTFVIKAHQPPNPALAAALQAGTARSIFLIRHPAAIVQSTLAFADHCRAYPELEPDNPYAAILDDEQAAEFVAPSIGWGRAWLASNACSVARYEDTFGSEARLFQAADRLHPGFTAVGDAVWQRMKPDQLSDDDRRYYRVNLIRRPKLSRAIVARCEEWAGQLGYAPDAAADVARLAA